MDSQTKIVFFGTPEFAVPSLKALNKEGYNIVLTVTQPDKPVGRKQTLTPSAVKVEAENLGLDVIEDLKTERLKDYNADVGIVVAYGKIIPKEILDLLPRGCLNIHPSLLPKYRGPSPIQAAILNGDKETGVSIIRLDEEMDHGSHVSCILYRVSNDETLKSLSEKLSQEGANLLIKTLPDYLSGEIKPVPQDDSKATFSKILKREDGKIDWQRSVEEIERQIRAYYPWPGSFTHFISDCSDTKSCVGQHRGFKIKILSSEISATKLDKEIGQFYDNNGQLTVNCGKGALIINKLQPEGKKEITGKEFINGYLT